MGQDAGAQSLEKELEINSYNYILRKQGKKLQREGW